MLQRADLIKEMSLEHKTFFVFFDNNGIIKSGLTNSLLSFFENENLEGSLELIIGDDLKIVKYFKETGKLFDFEGHEIKPLNFTALKISKKLEKPEITDLCIIKSFKAKLRGQGEIEKERLASRINHIINLRTAGGNLFLAPVLNVCQSSGSGKSKLAYEIMS